MVREGSMQLRRPARPGDLRSVGHAEGVGTVGLVLWEDLGGKLQEPWETASFNILSTWSDGEMEPQRGLLT